MWEQETTTTPPIESATVQLPGTIYVHLCSGEVRQIENVEEIAITDQYVIFACGELEAVIIERREVYYTCCEPGGAPSAF